MSEKYGPWVPGPPPALSCGLPNTWYGREIGRTMHRIRVVDRVEVHVECRMLLKPRPEVNEEMADQEAEGNLEEMRRP